MAVLACGYVGLFENGSGLLESSGKKASKNVQEKNCENIDEIMNDTIKLNMNEWSYYKEKKLLSKDKKALYGAICSCSVANSSENLSPRFLWWPLLYDH